MSEQNDTAKLRRLAEAASKTWGSSENLTSSEWDFVNTASPEVVLSLLDDNAAANAEIERLKDALGDPEGVIAHADSITAALSERVKKLEAAVAFYADKKNWIGSGWHLASPTKPAGTLERDPSAVEADMGAVARAALTSNEEG